MSSGTNFAVTPTSVTLPPISVTLGPPIGGGTGPSGPIGGGGALPGDGSYGDPIAGFRQINQQMSQSLGAFSASANATSASFNTALQAQSDARTAQQQAVSASNLATMNAQRAAQFAPPPITGPMLPPNFPQQIASPAQAGAAGPATPGPALAAGGLAVAPGASVGGGIAATAEAIGAALPEVAVLPVVAAGAGFFAGFFGGAFGMPDEAADTRARLDSETKLRAARLLPGAAPDQAAPGGGAEKGHAAIPAEPLPPAAFTPAPAGTPLPGFTPAPTTPGLEGVSLPPVFGPLPGFAAAPPIGLTIPGLTPAEQSPALPGFGVLDPGLSGPQVLEIGALQAARGDLIDKVDLRTRQLELGTDPARGYIPAEGIAGVRIEQALGRQIVRSNDPAVDFVDRILGPISLKGPIPENGSLEGLGQAVIRDATGGNTATRVLIVDTLGLSADQFEALKSAVTMGTRDAKKPIIFLR